MSAKMNSFVYRTTSTVLSARVFQHFKHQYKIVYLILYLYIYVHMILRHLLQRNVRRRPAVSSSSTSTMVRSIPMMKMIMTMLLFYINITVLTITTTSTTMTMVLAVADDTKDEGSTTSTPTTRRVHQYFLMGLPRSGSYLIHEFIQCMNPPIVHHSNPERRAEMDANTQREVQEEDVIVGTADATPNESIPKSSRAPPVLSSAHYCCDPHRDSSSSSLAVATSFFPCPSPMIPCGTCLQQHYHAATTNNDASSSSPASWTQSCGNYNVYTNFHVEATTMTQPPPDSSTTTTTETYTFFLPQHYTLPYLVSAPSEEDENDDTDTSTTVWILNHRATAEQWATQVLHWYSITNRILNSFQIPYYYYHNDDDNVAKVDTMTVEMLQQELDTTSFERLHNQTDHQRRLVELMAIHEYHIQTIQQFVLDYNQNNIETKKHRIQLYDINIDDLEETPLTLARALGYLPDTVAEEHGNRNDDTTTMTTVSQQCWQRLAATEIPNMDLDHRDFHLTTTFRASV